MRKYGESKTTRIVMATVPHVISGLGLRKFQADGFLLAWVYIRDRERERIAFHFFQGKGMGDDVFQANNVPSSRTPRGHQGPAGFLMLVSGLDKVRSGWVSDCRTNLIVPLFDLLPWRTLPYLCFIYQLVNMRGIKFLLAEVNYELEHVSFLKVTYQFLNFVQWKFSVFRVPA